MASKTRIAVIAAVSLTLAGLVVTPKLIGLGIRDVTTNSLVALVPPESQSQISFDEKQFDSGWFSTTTTLNANYIPFGTESIAMDFEFDIQHGPLLFTDNGLRLGISYAQITPKSDTGIPLFEANESLPLPDTLLELYVGFNQSLQVTLAVDPLEYSDNGSELKFAGLNANLIANADQSAEVTMNMGALSVEESKSGQNLFVEGIEIYTFSSQLNDILAPSTATFSVPSLKINGPLALQIDDLSVNSALKNSSNPNAVSMSQKINVSAITGDVPIESFQWTFEVDELQRSLVSEYTQLISNLQNQAATDPQTAAQNINLISQQLTQLFVNNPLIIKNQLSSQFYSGSHRADVEVSWKGLPQLSNIARLNLNEGLAALDFTVDISLDAEALSMSPISDQVNAYVQQGYLVFDQDRMVVTASLHNSKLMLNGEEIPLANFF